MPCYPMLHHEVDDTLDVGSVATEVDNETASTGAEDQDTRQSAGRYTLFVLLYARLDMLN